MTVQKEYNKTLGYLYDELARLNQNSCPPIITGNREPRVRLPPLKLPRFLGEENDWESFRDMFIAVTKRDEFLSDVEKLDLLKCSLEGKAKKALERLPTKETTFNVAWSILLKRYNHPRLLVTQHLNTLMTLPVLKKEDSNELQNLLDPVEIKREALLECGRPVEYWDDVFAFFLHKSAGLYDQEGLGKFNRQRR